MTAVSWEVDATSDDGDDDDDDYEMEDAPAS